VKQANDISYQNIIFFFTSLFVKEKQKLLCYVLHERAIIKMHDRSRDGNHTELIFTTTALINRITNNEPVLNCSNTHSNFCDKSILEDYINIIFNNLLLRKNKK